MSPISSHLDGNLFTRIWKMSINQFLDQKTMDKKFESNKTYCLTDFYFPLSVIKIEEIIK
jgi:hypothetical protein